MFSVFDVWWEITSKGLDEMSDVGRKMVSWTITPRNNRMERESLIPGFICFLFKSFGRCGNKGSAFGENWEFILS